MSASVSAATTAHRPIAERLRGGDPRALTNVDTVVELVLAQPKCLPELIAAVVTGGDDIVRMRAADALEKVCRSQPALLQPHVAVLLGDMARIDQPSVQWHVAQMLSEVRLTAAQRAHAARLVRANLDHSGDWIVLNCSLATLAALARQDPALLPPLREHLDRCQRSRYKSLANRARRLLAELG